MNEIRSYCTFEDRAEALTGIKLLALSLERHCRKFILWVVLTKEPDGFRDWLARHAPSARLLLFKPVGEGWNVKAEILAHFLAEQSEIIWIDSDIIVLRDLADLWSRSGDQLVVSEEFDSAASSDPHVEAAFGERRIRTLPHAVNSCVLRFSRRHQSLLDRWRELLLRPRYLLEQKKFFLDRATGLRSDQDVLEFVLSTSNDLGRGDPSYVRTGVDIIQDHGATTYALRHRLENAFGRGRPFFVHAQGAKPWAAGFKRRDSVYVEFAQEFADHLDDRLRRHRSLARALGLRPGILAHTVGIPRCVGGNIYRWFRSRFRRG